jgi:hypothetical protein
MLSVFQWFRTHSAAMLAAGLAVAKAGVLSKGTTAILLGIASALGASI